MKIRHQPPSKQVNEFNANLILLITCHRRLLKHSTFSVWLSLGIFPIPPSSDFLLCIPRFLKLSAREGQEPKLATLLDIKLPEEISSYQSSCSVMARASWSCLLTKGNRKDPNQSFSVCNCTNQETNSLPLNVDRWFSAPTTKSH